MESEYVPVRFPRWKYHPSGESRVVNDVEAENRLGAWWFDSPTERDAAVAVATAEAEAEAVKPFTPPPIPTPPVATVRKRKPVEPVTQEPHDDVTPER